MFGKLVTKNEKKILKEGVTKRDKFRIYLINVESFATKKIKPFLESFTHRSEFLYSLLMSQQQSKM